MISVQAPTELDTKHLYQLDATDDLPSGIIPLAVDHKIDHMYPKLLKIPLFNTEHNTADILRKTVIGNLQLIDVQDFKVSNTSWTTDNAADTTNSPMKLSCMLPKSSFQLDHRNTRHSMASQDAHIPKEATEGLLSLLEGEYSSIIFRSCMNIGRTNHSKWIS